jgi:hypothetical protein
MVSHLQLLTNLKQALFPFTLFDYEYVADLWTLHIQGLYSSLEPMSAYRAAGSSGQVHTTRIQRLSTVIDL